MCLAPLLLPFSSQNTNVMCELPSCVCVLSRFSRVQLFATLWTKAYQAPLSMGFSRQEYWSGVPLPSPFLIMVMPKPHNNHSFWKDSSFHSQSCVQDLAPPTGKQVSLEWTETSGELWEWLHDPGVPLAFSVESPSS